MVTCVAFEKPLPVILSGSWPPKLPEVCDRDITSSKLVYWTLELELPINGKLTMTGQIPALPADSSQTICESVIEVICLRIY